jgi:hypothetical protein
MKDYSALYTNGIQRINLHSTFATFLGCSGCSLLKGEEVWAKSLSLFICTHSKMMGIRGLALAYFGIFAATTVHSQSNEVKEYRGYFNSSCGSTSRGIGIVESMTFLLYVGVGGDTSSPIPLKDYRIDTYQNSFECYVSSHYGAPGRYITRSDVEMYLAVKLDKDVKATVTVTDELTNVPFAKPYSASKTFTGPIDKYYFQLLVPYENLPNNSHFPCGYFDIKHRLIISFDTTGNPTGKGHVMGRKQSGVMDFLWPREYIECPPTWSMCSESEGQKCVTNNTNPQLPLAGSI